MTRKWTIGTRAALGGLTAVAALVTATPAARADESNDLQANQELVQRRVDQLAQAQVPGNLFGVGGPPGPANVQMTGGSFPRSFLIPGTDTSIRVGGELRLSVLYWISGGNPNPTTHQTNAGATGQSASIPLNSIQAARNRGDNLFYMSPQQSKLSVETRTPTAWGEARTFIEFDFAQPPDNTNRQFAISDNISLRLRFAYGTLGPILGGQANSNFSDPDASVETISFSGLVGDPGHSRVPQLRWTQPLAGWGLLGALSVALETPETEMWFPGSNTICGYDAGATCPQTAQVGNALGLAAGTAIPNPLRTTAPDVTAAWYIPQPWGHVDFSAVLRPQLNVNNGVNLDKTYVGWGAHFGGDVKPNWLGWDKDFFTWHVVGGEAIGPFMNIASANSGLGLVSNYGAPGVTAANTVIKPVPAIGGNIGYRHVWTPELRSNIGAGIYQEDISNLNGNVCRINTAASRAGTGGCNLNKKVITAVANVIWSPVAFADVALEYFYGKRTTTGDQSGVENVLISRFRVRF